MRSSATRAVMKRLPVIWFVLIHALAVDGLKTDRADGSSNMREVSSPYHASILHFCLLYSFSLVILVIVMIWRPDKPRGRSVSQRQLIHNVIHQNRDAGGHRPMWTGTWSSSRMYDCNKCGCDADGDWMYGKGARLQRTQHCWRHHEARPIDATTTVCFQGPYTSLTQSPSTLIGLPGHRVSRLSSEYQYTVGRELWLLFQTAMRIGSSPQVASDGVWRLLGLLDDVSAWLHAQPSMACLCFGPRCSSASRMKCMAPCVLSSWPWTEHTCQHACVYKSGL